MFIIEPLMVIIFWARSPISFKHISFWVSVLGATPNHIPLKYRCPNKKWSWTRVVYSKVLQVLLSYHGTWLFSNWHLLSKINGECSSKLVSMWYYCRTIHLCRSTMSRSMDWPPCYPLYYLLRSRSALTLSSIISQSQKGFFFVTSSQATCAFCFRHCKLVMALHM